MVRANLGEFIKILRILPYYDSKIGGAGERKRGRAQREKFVFTVKFFFIM